jgi:4-azaleucine resistance transporter AzlC
MVLGAIPFAIIFGALANDAGLSPAATIGMSLFVFAGSAQFIGAGLVAQNASVAIIVLTTFVVNLRHVLYSASLGPYMKSLSQKWLLPLAFWLTDETYAVVIRRYAHDDHSPYKHWYHLGSSVFMYINWNCCTILGIVAGQRLSGLAELGLDFAMTVTFIGIVIPLVINRPMLVCAVVAGTTGVLTNHIPNKLGLMVAAILGIAAGMIAEALVKHPQQPVAHFREHETL